MFSSLKKIFITLLILSFSKTGITQYQITLDSLLKAAKFKFEQPTYFLQLNDRMFFAGDSVMFCAFIKANTSEFSNLSQSAFVQLLDSSGSIISEQKYLFVNNYFEGVLVLPTTLHFGYHFLRVTSINDSTESTIEPFLVVNKESVKKKISTNFSKRKLITETSFSKESLVDDLENNLTVRLKDQYNLPLNGKILLLSNNDTLQQYQSDEYGFTNIILVPDNSKEYSLKIITEYGEEFLTVPHKESGSVLNFSRTTNDYFFSIETKGNNQLKPEIIIGLSNYDLLFQTQTQFRNNRFLAKVERQTLPFGIIRVIALDKNYQLITERYFFSDAVDSNVLLQNSENSNDIKFDSRITGNITFTEEDSVLNFLHLQDFNNNLISKFFFTSYFKSPVYKASKLFAEANKLPLTTLNNCLATEPLHFKNWNDFLDNKITKNSKQSTFSDKFNLVGVASTKDYKNPVKKTELSFLIISKDSTFEYRTTTTDSKGIFQLSNLNFFDTVKIVYQPNKTISFPIVINWQKNSGINTPFHVINFINSMLPINLVVENDIPIPNSVEIFKERWQQQETKLKQLTTLPSITVASEKPLREKTKELELKYTTGPFTIPARRVLNFIDEPPPLQSESVWNYFRTHQTISDTPRLISGYSKYVYYINEQLVEQRDYESLLVMNVALIKVYPSGFIGSSGNSKSIVVYTKHWDDYSNLDKVSNNSEMVGFCNSTFSKDNHYKMGIVNWHSFSFYPQQSISEVLQEKADKNRNYLFQATSTNNKIYFLYNTSTNKH